jgi:hypothetical protein
MLVHPRTRGVILGSFAELLIDCEEDRTLRGCSSGCCEKARAGSCAPPCPYHAAAPGSGFVSVTWILVGGVGFEEAVRCPVIAR